MGNKSRREQRKEARSTKNKKKFDSWIEHQKNRKLKKSSRDSNHENVNKSPNLSIQSPEESEVLQTGLDYGDYSPERPAMLKMSELKLDSSGFPDSTELKGVERYKQLKKDSKSKFEEYLEMEMKQDVISAENDFELERKLAKKLKVKDGKLGGVDDAINKLFKGIPSVIDSFEEEPNPASKEILKRSKNSSTSKKRKKSMSLEKEPDDADEMAGDKAAMASKPVETFPADVEHEKGPAKRPELDGNAKYVAPHLRSRVRNESEEYSQIRRRVRGLLNRLSESNVESVTGEMSTIFRSVARSVGSQIITEEVLASCSGGPRGNEQYAAVFAAFVAGMASLVGIDFGAKLLAYLAKCFEDEYLDEDNISLRNLTLLLSYLYIFGVCSSDLIYDFMIMLSKRLMEVDVSTILTILQCCGMNLRGDDPDAMKNFVLSVQNRANELKAPSGNGQPSTISKRMEFMLETIRDIKNNKKRAKEDTPQHTRIKKWLQKLRAEDILIRGLKWSKLLDPDKKGQWWSSGDTVSMTSNVEEVASTIDGESLEAQKLLQLAGAQRMNTDVRRAIFCVIMSGEDYIDAFEKLLRLNLQGKQDREIMRVLVECCLQEQVFNKYYSVLATKLCSHDKKPQNQFKVLPLGSLQGAGDDAAEEIDAPSKICCGNGHLFHPLTILFEAIFEHPNSLVWNAFTRIGANPEFESLRSSIEFFINKYVVSSDKSLANKFKIVKKALANVEGVLIEV
ncbi:MIF4G domain-containing protein [Actinidia rufa]|uniref:MIF4G domain-containing protein n=1 Tax=Actinidia rufa TaxID=165716 RepID=A0A7J0EVM3_9ERIC|nr:MIF4G domain-containing protein [Actinidia rufa]